MGAQSGLDLPPPLLITHLRPRRLLGVVGRSSSKQLPMAPNGSLETDRRADGSRFPIKCDDVRPSRGSVSECGFHTCLECNTMVVSGSEVPPQAVCVSGANVIDRRSADVLTAHWSVFYSFLFNVVG